MYTHKWILLLLSSTLLFCCSSDSLVEPSELIPDSILRDTLIPSSTIIPNDSLHHNLQHFHLNPEETYHNVKKQIEQERRRLQSEKITLDSLSIYFKTALLNRIIPYWENTPWSFEGHTAVPQSGEIACGYFVSTTLQHIGLRLNRYKLAQQNPINEAKSLAIDIPVKTFEEPSTEENIKAIHNYLKEGIHFIGFDENHVGYILKEKDRLYIIHSNYLGTGVQIEAIRQSDVFQSFSTFHITLLSTNSKLLKYWLLGKEIPIVQE
jgi:hypothetical protein